ARRFRSVVLLRDAIHANLLLELSFAQRSRSQVHHMKVRESPSSVSASCPLRPRFDCEPNQDLVREDGVYGNREAVFDGSPGASRTTGSGEPGRAWFAVGVSHAYDREDQLRGANAATLGGKG